MLIREYCPKPEMLEIGAEIDGNQLNAIIDTGSNHNFINEEALKHLSLESEIKEDKLVIKTTNKEEVEVKKSINKNFYLAGF